MGDKDQFMVRASDCCHERARKPRRVWKGSIRDLTSVAPDCRLRLESPGRGRAGQLGQGAASAFWMRDEKSWLGVEGGSTWSDLDSTVF